jgi:hypothetical protein
MSIVTTTGPDADEPYEPVRGRIWFFCDTISAMQAWCGGVAYGNWHQLSDITKTKRANLGMSLILTAGIGAFGVACVVSEINNPGALNKDFELSWSMLPVFLVWFSIMLWFDRGMLISMNGTHAKSRIITSFILRFVIALGLAEVSGTIINEMLFKNEISDELHSERAVQVKAIETERDALVAPVTKKIDPLRKETTDRKSKVDGDYAEWQGPAFTNKQQQVATAETNYATWHVPAKEAVITQRASVQKLDDVVTAEIGGEARKGVTTGREGDGPVAKQRKKELENQKALLAQMEREFEAENTRRLKERDSKVAAVNNEYETESNRRLQDKRLALESISTESLDRLKELEDERTGILDLYNGRLTNLNALPIDGLGNRARALFRRMWQNFLILSVFIVLLIVEMMPYLLKVFSKKDDYDEIVDCTSIAAELQTRREQVAMATARATAMGDIHQAARKELVTQGYVMDDIGTYLTKTGIVMSSAKKAKVLTDPELATLKRTAAQVVRSMQRSLPPTATAV